MIFSSMYFAIHRPHEIGERKLLFKGSRALSSFTNLKHLMSYVFFNGNVVANEKNEVLSCFVNKDQRSRF
jgi:hypothetical protein